MGCRLAGLIVVLLLSGCAPATPRLAAEAYLNALSRLDFEGAASLVSDGGQADFRALRALSDGLPEAERAKFRMTGWSIVTEERTGDRATVSFAFGDQQRGTLELTRTNGVWKVDRRLAP